MSYLAENGLVLLSMVALGYCLRGIHGIHLAAKKEKAEWVKREADFARSKREAWYAETQDLARRVATLERKSPCSPE